MIHPALWWLLLAAVLLDALTAPPAPTPTPPAPHHTPAASAPPLPRPAHGTAPVTTALGSANLLTWPHQN